MACFNFTIPGFGISITVPVLNAAINALLAYNEYTIYADHRDRLDKLTDRNMKLAHIVEDANDKLLELRDEAYEKMQEEIECEPCCNQMDSIVFRNMANPMNTYANAVDNLHYSQIGSRGAFMRNVLKNLPVAIESASDFVNREEMTCQRIKQNQQSAQISSGYRGELPSPSILADVAQTNATALNTSSIILSQFIDESMRSIGVQMAYNKQRQEPEFKVGRNYTSNQNSVENRFNPTVPVTSQYNAPALAYTPVSAYGVPNNGKP